MGLNAIRCGECETLFVARDRDPVAAAEETEFWHCPQCGSACDDLDLDY